MKTAYDRALYFCKLLKSIRIEEKKLKADTPKIARLYALVSVA